MRLPQKPLRTGMRFNFAEIYTTTDGGGDFFCTFVPETNVTVLVADQHIAHKSVGLTSRTHLLYRVDLHHFIFKRASNKKRIDDLIFFDGQGMKIDVFNRLNLPIFHEAAELCYWHPLFFLTFALTFSLFAFALALSFAFVAEATAFAKATLTHCSLRT